MITSLDQLDLQKRYSYADYLSWQFDEFVELIKGKIMPMSAPTRVHQEISMLLSRFFINHLLENKTGCKVYAAPFDVRLLKNPSLMAEDLEGKTDKEIYTVVQPDLCVICDLEKLDERGCVGAPDLIIEILSEKNARNARRDVVDKFEIYEENGVKEYWLARPTEKTIQKFTLNPQTLRYDSSKYFGIGDIVPCSTLPDLNIIMDEVFE